MRVYFIVGEPSGDILASRLIKAIRNMRPDVQFFGIGGETMRAEGFRSLFDINILSVMGFAEVVPRLPAILRRRKEMLAHIKHVQPNVIVSIDSWGYVNSVLKLLKKSNCTIPKVHYVAPQVWAWKKGRAKKVARLVDHLMTLLPYEPPLFEKYGLTCTFVGHPVIENTANLPIDISLLRKRFRSLSEVEMPENVRVVCVLPGSRHSEVSRLAPVFVESIKRIQNEIPNLFLLIPAVETMKEEVDGHFKDIGIPYRIITGQQARYEAFRMSEFAIAASGTVSLELSACGTPHLIAYTFSALTNWMAEVVVKIKYANLINILADRFIIPEFVLRNCNAERIALEAISYLRDSKKGENQMMLAKEQLKKLKPVDKLPSEKAAEVVLGVIADKTT